jgi:hypothetical protein
MIKLVTVFNFSLSMVTMTQSCTIVSAFIPNANSNRSTSTYLELAGPLVSNNNPKIIFIDPSLTTALNKLPNTTIIPFKKSELFYSDLVSETTTELPTSRNPNKDTLDYLVTMNNKTEWVRKAIQLNPYKTSQFMWIDFGIQHIFSSAQSLTKALNTATSKSYNDKVRIAGIWPLNKQHFNSTKTTSFNTPQWYLAGGVFGGNHTQLIQFADKAKQATFYQLNNNRLTWEVNIWSQVCHETPELFNIYKSDHNESILTGY